MGAPTRVRRPSRRNARPTGRDAEAPTRRTGPIAAGLPLAAVAQSRRDAVDGEVDAALGAVVAIAGPVIDVEFPPSSLPELNSALEFQVEIEGRTQTVLAEKHSR